jgi:bifunctional enzyme CysN/CysC
LTTSSLHFMTCGSVDDGKSTLIGRLLCDAGLVAADQLAELERESRARSHGAEGLDFSLLLDGLTAEREQGITIDVAYRYFATAERSFIVADAPGHEQYTRNMVTAASNAQAALVLVDARKGCVAQTRRHASILALMGVREVALIVNKMDLVAYGEARFREVSGEFRALAKALGMKSIAAIPTAATTGANVVDRSAEMNWYTGPTLFEWLGQVAPADVVSPAFRMPVQWVNRANADFRGLAGTIASGRIAIGDRIASARSGRTSDVARVVTMDGDLNEASAGQAITLLLQDDLDIARGDLLFDPAVPPITTDQFAAKVVWLDEKELLPGRSYLTRIGTDVVATEITRIEHELSMDDLKKSPAAMLAMNAIGFCHVTATRPVSFETYQDNHRLGGFILIDRASSATVGAGMIEFPLRRALNLAWHDFDIDRERRAAQKAQRPAIVWLTGLSGAGKSTIANIVDRRLYELGRHTFLLDGDNLRRGLNKDLGFLDKDRVENVRRVANVARLMAEAGLIAIVALISPFRRERQLAREIAGDVDFFEIFVDAPLTVCQQRDPRGLYAMARAGQIAHLTGIDSAYEPPDAPDLHLHTDRIDAMACADAVLALMRRGRPTG